MEIKLKINADLIGAGASTLCTIHCLATPFLFLASTCTKSCCSAAPSWWLWIDYAFLLISFFAIYKSTRITSKFWIKPTLWMSWIPYLQYEILQMQVRTMLCRIKLD